MTENQTTNKSDSIEMKKTKNNTTLWVMIFLFGMPYVAATYFYFNRDNIDLGLTSNYGTIISPVRSVTDRQLKKLDETDFKLSSLRGKWIILSIGSSACQQDCIDNLYKIRQLRKAVGQEYKRIAKVFFLQDKNNLQSFTALLKDYPDMDVIIPSGSEYERYLSIFSYHGSDIKDGIFIIDPLGNYMMMYPKGADPSKIIKDIERLLKISKIG